MIWTLFPRDYESGDGALCTSPVSMIDEEPAVISVYSSDSDPDLSEELCQFRPLNGPLSPVPSDVSLGVVESPSHYPTPAEPVVLSAVSSVQISPNRVREDCSSVTLDVYPVYEVSTNTTYYVPTISPVTPQIPEGSLLPPGPESLPLGAPASLDSLLAYDITLLDRDTDLSLLAVPLLPLPDDLLLLPVIASEHPQPLRNGRRRRNCFPLLLLLHAPSDTGDHLLISDGLPGCP